MSEAIKHSGVKGMHWGVRKEEPQAVSTTSALGRRSVREIETAVTLVGVAALGVAFARSPRAQTMMMVPTKAAFHYMSDSNNRRKVGKFIKGVGIVYSKL